MGHTGDDEYLPDLTERLLMGFAPAGAGWIGDLEVLPDGAVAEIRELLQRRLTAGQVDRVPPICQSTALMEPPYTCFNLQLL